MFGGLWFKIIRRSGNIDRGGVVRLSSIGAMRDQLPGFLGVAFAGSPSHGALIPVTQTFRSKVVEPCAD